jgi:type IV secretory pathway VirD2 relaxase
MDKKNPFQIRPGRIRAKSAQRVRPFIHQALAAAQKAGATVRRGHITTGRSNFGRGRQATQIANRLLSHRSRLAVIKARVVRHRGRATPLQAHLRYLQREGATRDGDKAVLFGPDQEQVDVSDFAERCADDRHHFRFIVSPEDAHQMEDLHRFTCDLMEQAAADLGTSLDWAAVTHWNTEHPHIHLIVRGVTDAGDDLVIGRDYIKEGLRARAQGLITDELGLRTDNDIRQTLHRQVDSDRFTQLDRQLLSDAKQTGFVDLAPVSTPHADSFQVLKAGRLRKLESLGLADQFAPGQWIISERAEPVLRELGERGDIIKRIHKGLAESQLDRASDTLVLSAGMDAEPLTGRLLARGLDDELKGTAYIVVDGTDGRTRHISLPSLEASGDSAVGSIVSVRYVQTDDVYRSYIHVESDLDVQSQVAAEGSTWLDRQLIKTTPSDLAESGFGAEVGDALERRTEHLIQEGLAKRNGDRLTLSPGLLQNLQAREFERVTDQLSNNGARAVTTPAEGDQISGVYRRRLDLASGRFAVLDDGMGFHLVPWSPKLEAHLGELVTGQMRSRTAVSWDIGRSKGIGIDM